MIKKIWALGIISSLLLCLSSCGFHLQGETELAWPLYKMYLHSTDPYGFFVRQLRDQLKMSKVQLVDSSEQATTILDILKDDISQDLLNVNGTQQTRQYILKTTLVFEIRNAQNQVILPPQTLEETRVITVQANQILGSSNEVSFYYKQMRRQLVSALMNRLSSKEVSRLLNHSFPTPQPS